MTFTKRLREGVRRGEITCSVRIWTRPRVAVGKRYRMDDGEIEVHSITPIGFPDITPELARESGFLGVVDLLKVAKHGKGTNIYLVRFHYVRPRKKAKGRAQAPYDNGSSDHSSGHAPSSAAGWAQAHARDGLCVHRCTRGPG